MLNKEKYEKEILDIVCKTGDFPAVVKNRPDECGNIKCEYCDFNTMYSCREKFVEWANSEYKEPEIDWTKVPIDTPVYVWNDYGGNKLKRYFAGYDKNNDKIIAFSGGQISWSADIENVVKWDHAEIKEGVDCSEWYKD